MRGSCEGVVGAAYWWGKRSAHHPRRARDGGTATSALATLRSRSIHRRKHLPPAIMLIAPRPPCSHRAPRTACTGRRSRCRSARPDIRPAALSSCRRLPQLHSEVQREVLRVDDTDEDARHERPACCLAHTGLLSPFTRSGCQSIPIALQAMRSQSRQCNPPRFGVSHHQRSLRGVMTPKELCSHRRQLLAVVPAL